MALPKGGYAASAVQDGPFADNNNRGFALDTASTDAYAIAPVPAFTGYFVGMRVSFKAVTANTGACSVNVNGLGAKSLKMLNDQDPPDNFIEAGSIVGAIYDGTYFQIVEGTDANP